MVDAREYHERTTHTPQSVRQSDGLPPLSTKPRPFKQYRDLPTEPLSSIRAPMQPALATIAHSRADPLADAEQSTPASLDRETLATLCYEAAGVVQRVTAQDGRELPFRAASCTGNLHHVDCYIVCGDLGDLDAGVYHFDPPTFSLDVLREGDYRSALAESVRDAEADADAEVAAAEADANADATGSAPAVADSDEDGPPATVRSAPVTVVATSTWERNAWKYRERTYRHAFWDAGTILANLLATAHALDYRAEVVAGFADQQVADLVGVDPEREAPIALAPVGTGQPAGEAPAVEPIDPGVVAPTEHPVETAPIHDAWAQSALDDGAAAAQFRQQCLDRGKTGIRAVAAGMRTVPADAAGDPHSSSSESPSSDAARSADASSSPDESGTDGDARDDGPIALGAVDPATASARPLHHTIQRRGSRREFADDGPSRRAVGTVLDRAFRGVPADWNGGDAAGLTYNDAYVLATGVEGLADGAYSVDLDRRSTADADGGSADGADTDSADEADGDSESPSSADADPRSDGAFVRVGDADRESKAHLALDQDWAGDAHVNVYLLANVDAIVEALGDRGYRLAQLEAGVALGRLYLATYAHRDLGGLGLTFYDDLVAERFAPTRSNQHSEQPSGELEFVPFARTPTCLFAFGTSAR